MVVRFCHSKPNVTETYCSHTRSGAISAHLVPVLEYSIEKPRRKQKVGKHKFMLAPSLVWQAPCLLEENLLRQQIIAYDRAEFDFEGVAEKIFACAPGNLGTLHEEPIVPWDKTPPALRRAQVQARIGASVTKVERKGARRNAWDFDRSEGWRAFQQLYQRYIHDWVMPQLGNEPLLYQRKPILRVVLPGSVAPTQLHCDAEYYHSENELNFWVPLSSVGGSNSLWSESEPGRGDYASFEAGPGQAVRFYGNRCRHYTVPNDSDRTRVSFDFRVIPESLFSPPSDEIAKLSKHSLCPGNSKRGYYAVAYPARTNELQPSSASTNLRSVTLGAQRRAWREKEGRRRAGAGTRTATHPRRQDENI